MRPSWLPAASCRGRHADLAHPLGRQPVHAGVLGRQVHALDRAGHRGHAERLVAARHHAPRGCGQTVAVDGQERLAGTVTAPEGVGGGLDPAARGHGRAEPAQDGLERGEGGQHGVLARVVAHRADAPHAAVQRAERRADLDAEAEVGPGRRARASPGTPSGISTATTLFILCATSPKTSSPRPSMAPASIAAPAHRWRSMTASRPSSSSTRAHSAPRTASTSPRCGG